MLDFSPDWNARYCYLVVLICAFFSAYVQIFGRLKTLQSKIIYAWSLWRTWWVFSIYLCIPLLLFWLLDRTGAIRDTSLFAAILVGLAYPAVLSGGTSLKPNAGMAGIFDWLNQAADSLATKTNDYVASADRIFARAIIRHINEVEGDIKDNTPYNEVRKLALDLAESPARIEAELEAAKTLPEKAQIVYDYATNSVHGLKPITNLVEKWNLKPLLSLSPYRQAQKWLLGYSVMVAALLLLTAAIVYGEAGDNRFLIWRLTKPGVSLADLNRASAVLQAVISTNDARALKVRASLLAALHTPNLEMPRADCILSLLLRDRGKPGEGRFAEISQDLARSLRVNSVDVRARVHFALLLLADEVLSSIPASESKQELERKLSADLKEWKPLAAQSKIDLEKTVRIWREWWANAPVK